MEGLEQLIEKERKSGVFLSVLGYGMGNYKDNKGQALAEKGNGNHAYIDNLQEANRVLVGEFGATLHTVAKDVKLQVEFNPAQVQAYRLVGYESRLLKDEDFNNDAKDAGELGAGHTVTAFYEVIPVGVKNDYVGKIDDLKYQKKQKETVQPTGSNELLTVKLRYKAPDKDVSKKMEVPFVDNKGNNVSSDFRFASAVAMFGQLLRDSDFKGEASYDKVIGLAKQGLDNDFSHSSGLKPTRTKLSVTTNGRFTSLPFVASNAICSSSVMEGSFSLSFSSLYTKPLVLKNFFIGNPLRGIHAFNSSTVGLSSTMSRLVYSMLFSISHFLAFWHVLHAGYCKNKGVILYTIYRLIPNTYYLIPIT